MKIGDFFRSAPHARPVNPRPVAYTATTREAVLPGGGDNPTGRQVSARVTSAFAFVSVHDLEEARISAREYLLDRFSREDPKTKVKLVRPVDEDTVELEIAVQIVWRALREYDEGQGSLGDQQWPDINLFRKCVVPKEISRLYEEYKRYVAEEHPEGVDRATFRGDEGGGAGVA